MTTINDKQPAAPERIYISLLEGSLARFGKGVFLTEAFVNSIEYARVTPGSGGREGQAKVALNRFGDWYMTLGHMNPEALISLKEIIPAELLAEMADAALATEDYSREKGIRNHMINDRKEAEKIAKILNNQRWREWTEAAWIEFATEHLVRLCARVREERREAGVRCLYLDQVVTIRTRPGRFGDIQTIGLRSSGEIQLRTPHGRFAIRG
jgi:hypothetical protein